MVEEGRRLPSTRPCVENHLPGETGNSLRRSSWSLAPAGGSPLAFGNAVFSLVIRFSRIGGCPSQSLLISVQFSRSVVSNSLRPHELARQASLSITNSGSPPKPMSIESVMPSNHLIFYRPLLLLPSIFLSIRVFSNESIFRIRWPKYWSFSFNISPSNEGLISRMDWLDLLAVQRTLKSLLQHHSSKASILQHSALIVQLSHPYMTTGKTIALTIWTFSAK